MSYSNASCPAYDSALDNISSNRRLALLEGNSFDRTVQHSNTNSTHTNKYLLYKNVRYKKVDLRDRDWELSLQSKNNLPLYIYAPGIRFFDINIINKFLESSHNVIDVLDVSEAEHHYDYDSHILVTWLNKSTINFQKLKIIHFIIGSMRNSEYFLGVHNVRSIEIKGPFGSNCEISNMDQLSDLKIYEERIIKKKASLLELNNLKSLKNIDLFRFWGNIILSGLKLDSLKVGYIDGSVYLQETIVNKIIINNIFCKKVLLIVDGKKFLIQTPDSGQFLEICPQGLNEKYSGEIYIKEGCCKIDLNSVLEINPAFAN